MKCRTKYIQKTKSQIQDNPKKIDILLHKPHEKTNNSSESKTEKEKIRSKRTQSDHKSSLDQENKTIDYNLNEKETNASKPFTKKCCHFLVKDWLFIYPICLLRKENKSNHPIPFLPPKRKRKEMVLLFASLIVFQE